MPFDGSAAECPTCGASFSTGAKPIENNKPPYEGDPDEEYEPDDYEPTVTVKKKQKTVKPGQMALGILAFIGAFFIFVFVVAMVEIAKEEIETVDGNGNSGNYDDLYKEEGHAIGEAYTGAITLSADISDYENVISFAEEPKLQWGDGAYNSDTLMIHAKVHNESDKDISYLSFSFDIVWKDDTPAKYMSASVYDLFAGQDEYIDDSVFIYEPKTYDDIKEIKLTEVRISYE
jgi:hypothetical protein